VSAIAMAADGRLVVGFDREVAVLSLDPPLRLVARAVMQL
jgi:hypothetical protein